MAKASPRAMTEHRYELVLPDGERVSLVQADMSPELMRKLNIGTIKFPELKLMTRT